MKHKYFYLTKAKLIKSQVQHTYNISQGNEHVLGGMDGNIVPCFYLCLLACGGVTCVIQVYRQERK